MRTSFSTISRGSTGVLASSILILVAITLAVAVTGPVAASAGTGQHGAITITSNSDFTAPGSAAGCACVTAGNGTAASPYVIGPWTITAPSGGSSGWAIKIDNSGGGVTSSFTISGTPAAADKCVLRRAGRESPFAL